MADCTDIPKHGYTYHITFKLTPFLLSSLAIIPLRAARRGAVQLLVVASTPR